MLKTYRKYGASLERKEKTCYNILFKERSHKVGTHLTKWRRISNRRDDGGGELKNINVFYASLSRKAIWKLITKEIIW